MENFFNNPKYKYSSYAAVFYLIFGFLILIVDGGVSDAGLAGMFTWKFAISVMVLILTAVAFYFLMFFLTGKERDVSGISFGTGFSKEDFELSPFLIVVFNNKGTIKFANNKFLRVSEHKLESVIGKSIGSLSDMKSGDFQKLIDDLISSKESFSEFSCIKESGKKYFEIATVFPVKNDPLWEDHLLKVSVDITHLKDKETDISRKKNKAEMLNNAKTQFLASLSQEIRTPMSGIIGMAELLQLTKLTEQQKEYLDIINFSSSTLLAIINDILDFSRMETGQLKLDCIEFSIRELILKTAHILDLEARKKQLSMNLKISPSIKYNVSSDPLRTNQIVINLLKNAIKYTDKGEVGLELTEKSKDGNNVVLIMKVTDTGAGMPEDLIKEFSVDIDCHDKLSSFEYKGKGFGLAVVKYLVCLMKGTLVFESEKDKGTTITVELPYAISKEYEEKPAEEGKPSRTSTDQINILVAEDNPVNQRLVKELLTRKNYNVTMVENGLKLFDVMEEKRFDLILMDIQMPVMDGLEATSIIREIEKGTGRHIPIIGITAYAVKADKEKCLSVGMDDYLSKPFIKEDFYNLLEKYLNEQQ
jgi:signal transduction histidine kinase/CheY-like chemotaxis protein